MQPLPTFSKGQIRAARPAKVAIDPWQPQGIFVEQEKTADGTLKSVLTVLLSGKECPFTCLFCDLWKHTTDEPTPVGAIPAQIEQALKQFPQARSQIKLYNAGNFFDAAALPEADWRQIANLVQPFERVIVECHPRLITSKVEKFAKLLSGKLEIAMGLETIHPEILPKLNKEFTLSQFEEACQRLRNGNIDIRLFLMHRPPGLTEEEGIIWTVKSVLYAHEQGATCASIIPTRGGNGILEQLAREGLFTPPTSESLVAVAQQLQTLPIAPMRVFFDTWGLDAKHKTSNEQLEIWNEHQTLSPPN